jgi:hypothetical protein
LSHISGKNEPPLRAESHPIAIVKNKPVARRFVSHFSETLEKDELLQTLSLNKSTFYGAQIIRPFYALIINNNLVLAVGAVESVDKLF